MIQNCLSGLGLPIQIPSGIAPHAIMQAMGFDKKSVDGTLRFTLPVRVGRVKVGVQVKDWEHIVSEWSSH